MATVGIDGSSEQADSQPKWIGLAVTCTEFIIFIWTKDWIMSAW